MQQFAGGVGQAGYMDRIRALTPEQCLVVPVDVGKRTAMMLVADHFGHVVCGPVEFTLTTSGLAKFVDVVIQARQRTAAGSVRVGIEAAGHYHWALASGLRAERFDVVELNPYHVKMARAQMGQARVKTDLRDCMAMVELLVRGQGWPVHRSDGATAPMAAVMLSLLRASGGSWSVHHGVPSGQVSESIGRCPTTAGIPAADVEGLVTRPMHPIRIARIWSIAERSARHPESSEQVIFVFTPGCTTASG